MFPEPPLPGRVPAGDSSPAGSGVTDPPPHDFFPETHWSAIRVAAECSPEKARAAFEQLCADYREAIVRWMWLQRLTPEDAEDAAHDFLAQWLHRANPLQGFKPGERRFREFLRVCLRHFLSDWRVRRLALCRGGGGIHLPWNHDEVVEDTSDTVPLIDVAIARQTHERTLAKLAESWNVQLPRARFDRFRSVALGEVPNPGYESLARELGVAIGTLKAWVFRLRRDYYDTFRAAVDPQVEPELVGEEVAYLHGLLFRAPPLVEEKTGGNPQPPPPDSR